MLGLLVPKPPEGHRVSISDLQFLKVNVATQKNHRRAEQMVYVSEETLLSSGSNV